MTNRILWESSLVEAASDLRACAAQIPQNLYVQALAVVVMCIAGELDAEMAPAGEPDEEHRLVHSGILDGGRRPAAEDGFKAPGQLLAPMRAGEDMHIAAKSDHDLVCPLSSDGQVSSRLIPVPGLSALLWLRLRVR
jgi:hypothetical protein